MYKNIDDVLKYIELSNLSDHDKNIFKNCCLYIQASDKTLNDYEQRIKELEDDNQALSSKYKKYMHKANGLQKTINRLKKMNDEMQDQLIQLKSQGAVNEQLLIANKQRNEYRELAKKFKKERDDERAHYLSSMRAAHEEIVRLKNFLQSK